NFNGADTLTIIANDQGNSGGGGGLTDTRTVAISVTAVNDAPVFNAVNNQTAFEDSGAHNVSITGVGPGGGADESAQTVTVTATSSDTSIVPDPTVTTSGATRTLTYTEAANATGTVTITVTAMDSGGTSNGGVNTFSRTFTITINGVNDPPVFDVINSQ